jgi:hypothetical protein
LVRNETYSILGSPPSQPSPIKGEGVLMVDLISIISNCKRYKSCAFVQLSKQRIPKNGFFQLKNCAGIVLRLGDILMIRKLSSYGLKESYDFEETRSPELSEI